MNVGDVVMSKPLETRLFLLERARKIVERIAPDMPIKVEITYQDDQIEWDKDGSFGRVPLDGQNHYPVRASGSRILA